MKRMRNLKGFTLIELIVVILILGILAAIAVVGYTNITDEANKTAVLANAKQIVSAVSADATLAGSATVDQFLTVDVTKIDADGTAGADFPTTTSYLDKFDVDAVYLPPRSGGAGKVSVGSFEGGHTVLISLDGPVAQIITTP